jgi:hypothetical protein
MFFPWVGMFEQLRLADVYVHYDDVQFSKGSFTNRVQVKTSQGIKWLTIPLESLRLGQRINEVQVSSPAQWAARHTSMLAQAYRGAPYRDEMLALVGDVYATSWSTLADLSIASMHAVFDYFELGQRTAFHRSSTLQVGGASDDRVLAVVRHFGGSRYVTGHGARSYLDHEMFEAAGVDVEYLDYEKRPYPQLHGEFTPFVSILDLIANRGRAGVEVLSSPSIAWRDFLHRSTHAVGGSHAVP